VTSSTVILLSSTTDLKRAVSSCSRPGGCAKTDVAAPRQSREDNDNGRPGGRAAGAAGLSSSCGWYRVAPHGALQPALLAFYLYVLDGPPTRPRTLPAATSAKSQPPADHSRSSTLHQLPPLPLRSIFVVLTLAVCGGRFQDERQVRPVMTECGQLSSGSQLHCCIVITQPSSPHLATRTMLVCPVQTSLNTTRQDWQCHHAPLSCRLSYSLTCHVP